MSTGQKQRVKLAQAIVHDPQLVLLDEPTNGLDPVQRDEMLNLIRRCGHELGLSVILSSHLLDEIERTCDRVSIVANNVVTDGGELRKVDEYDRELVPLYIELDGGDEVIANFARLLNERGLVARNDGNLRNLVVVEPGPTNQVDHFHDTIRDTLALLDLGVRSMKRHTKTLENLFFEATR